VIVEAAALFLARGTWGSVVGKIVTIGAWSELGLGIVWLAAAFIEFCLTNGGRDLRRGGAGRWAGICTPNGVSGPLQQRANQGYEIGARFGASHYDRATDRWGLANMSRGRYN
jgi:hypothetical protein